MANPFNFFINPFKVQLTPVVTTYTSGSGNWTCPAGVTEVYVECWGGGGHGGLVWKANSYSTITSAGGGGAGAYAAGTVAVTPGNSYAYAVGAGGIGNIESLANAGNSTFNSTSIVAAGGNSASILGDGPSHTYAPGAAGGTVAASTGTVKYAGGDGNKGYYYNNHAYSGSGGGAAGSTGRGGNAQLPPGTGAGQSVGGTGTAVGGGNGANGADSYSPNFNVVGNKGSTYGGGGSGAVTFNARYLSSGTYLAGGNGAAGAVRITYYL